MDRGDPYRVHESGSRQTSLLHAGNQGHSTMHLVHPNYWACNIFVGSHYATDMYKVLFNCFVLPVTGLMLKS